MPHWLLLTDLRKTSDNFVGEYTETDENWSETLAAYFVESARMDLF